MARRLAREAVVEIEFGGPDDGTPSWGTPITLQGKAREVTIRQTGDAVNLAGIGEAYARMRFGGNAQQTLTVEGFLTAYTFEYFQSGVSPIGYVARVSIKPHSTLTTGYVFTGVITDWQWSASAGERQIERFELTGPLDE